MDVEAPPAPAPPKMTPPDRSPSERSGSAASDDIQQSPGQPGALATQPRTPHHHLRPHGAPIWLEQIPGVSKVLRIAHSEFGRLVLIIVTLLVVGANLIWLFER